MLQGTLTDASTQQGIVGATVSLFSFGRVLPADGGFTITTQTVAGGSYSFDSSSMTEVGVSGYLFRGQTGYAYISAPGYLTLTPPDFSIVPPYPFTKNFSLISAGATVLQGIVTDRNTGSPLAGVTVKGCVTCSVATTTDASGAYSLTGAQAGGASGVEQTPESGPSIADAPQRGDSRVAMV